MISAELEKLLKMAHDRAQNPTIRVKRLYATELAKTEKISRKYNVKRAKKPDLSQEPRA